MIFRQTRNLLSRKGRKGSNWQGKQPELRAAVSAERASEGWAGAEPGSDPGIWGSMLARSQWESVRNWPGAGAGGRGETGRGWGPHANVWHVWGVLMVGLYLQ